MLYIVAPLSLIFINMILNHRLASLQRPVQYLPLICLANIGTPHIVYTIYAVVLRVDITIYTQYKNAQTLCRRPPPPPPPRDLILGRRCTQHQTCNALSGHSLSLLLGGVRVNPRCYRYAHRLQCHLSAGIGAAQISIT